MKFFLKLTLLTSLLSLVTAVYLYFFEPGEDMWFWVSLSYYFILGIVIGRKTQKAVISKSNSQFFGGVMGSIGIRVLLCVVFLAIYLMVSDLKSKEFIVYYLILYLFYTIFEIYQLVSKLRPEKETKVDNATP